MRAQLAIEEVLAVLDEECRSGVPAFKPWFFNSNLVRVVMAWARTKGFEEAAAIARREVTGSGGKALADALQARKDSPPLVNVHPIEVQ